MKKKRITRANVFLEIRGEHSIFTRYQAVEYCMCKYGKLTPCMKQAIDDLYKCGNFISG